MIYFECNQGFFPLDVPVAARLLSWQLVFQNLDVRGCMEAYRIETVVAQDGTLVIKGLPLRAGEEVEVIILSRSYESGVKDRYPLRGKPVRYLAPFESVAEDDWEALQ